MSDAHELRPNAVEPDQFDALARILHAVPEVDSTVRLVGPEGIETEVPAGIRAVLVSIVDNLTTGNGVSALPMHAELTAVEAADLLNVSLPTLIKMIDAGELPHNLVDTHRRLHLADVLACRDLIEAESNDALAAMTAEAEDLGLYGR
jgi:excisionase family DNA binding protein